MLVRLGCLILAVLELTACQGGDDRPLQNAQVQSPVTTTAPNDIVELDGEQAEYYVIAYIECSRAGLEAMATKYKTSRVSAVIARAHEETLGESPGLYHGCLDGLQGVPNKVWKGAP